MTKTLFQIACFVGLLGACDDDSPSKAQPLQRGQLEASWDRSAHSLKELKDFSDFGVRGRIATPPRSAMESGIPYTYQTLKVEEVLWNDDPSRQVPTDLPFKQTGGIIDNELLQFAEDPLYRGNEETIIFFSEYEPGKYRAELPSGRFKVDNGVVLPVYNRGVEIPAGTRTGQFGELVKNAVLDLRLPPGLFGRDAGPRP